MAGPLEIVALRCERGCRGTPMATYPLNPRRSWYRKTGGPDEGAITMRACSAGCGRKGRALPSPEGSTGSGTKGEAESG
jgi:hypothetical protein